MTVSEILQDLRMSFKDVEVDMILRQLNEAHLEICSEFPLYNRTDTLTLVADDPTYAITSDVTAVRRAVYFSTDNPTRGTDLEVTTVQELDSDRYKWRSEPSGIPRQIMRDGDQFRLLPAPNTASSGSPSLPRVELYVEYVPVLTQQSTLPNSVPAFGPYLRSVTRRKWVELDLSIPSHERTLGIVKKIEDEERFRFEAAYDRFFPHYKQQIKPDFTLLMSRRGS